MNKLRKIAQLFWYNKERLIFVALVGVLCWRVYEVMNPKEVLESAPSHTAPRPPTAEDVPPPKMPDPIIGKSGASDGSLNSIRKRNPFWYYSDQTKTETAPKDNQQAVPALLRVLGNRVQLEMGSEKKWCTKGATFGEYEVRNIDPAAQTCEVYSGQSGRSETLSVKGK